MNTCIFRVFLLLDWVLFLAKPALYVLYIWFPSYTAQLFLEKTWKKGWILGVFFLLYIKIKRYDKSKDIL